MRLLVATRKGLFRLERRPRGWRVQGPHFLGVAVTCTMRDPRDGAIWAALRYGHFGPKLHVSRDDFRSFAEVACPAFPEGCAVDAATPMGPRRGPASVRAVFALAPAGPAGRVHAGTDPGGLFTTRDGGATWTLDEALWRRRNADGWFAGGGGLMLHAVLVDPRDPRHLHVAVSCGGVFETRDGGTTWEPRNRGVPTCFLPDASRPTGQDTYALRRHARRPDLLWQQNRCGTFRSEDGGTSWRECAPFGGAAFALALHDDDEGVAWTVPMDSDERRVAPRGALAVHRTDDAGRTWRALGKGLPQRHCYDIVFRHALDAKGDEVAFGTTCGRVFVSADRGESWRAAARYLPPVFGVRFER